MNAKIGILRNPEKRAAFVFGQPMIPCPKCDGFDIGYSTPIKIDGEWPNTARGLISAWAKAHKKGNTPLEGTCRIMCRKCGHKGPSVDVTGRTAEDIGMDPIVAAAAKRLWNSQEKKGQQ